MASLVIVVSAVLVLSCEQTDTQTDADERFTPATLVIVSNYLQKFYCIFYHYFNTARTNCLELDEKISMLSKLLRSCPVYRFVYRFKILHKVVNYYYYLCQGVKYFHFVG